MLEITDTNNAFVISRSAPSVFRRTRRHQGKGFALARAGPFVASIMTAETPLNQMTRAEKETQSAAERLHVQIEDALAAVAVRANNDRDELEACAHRLERAARDLAVALRELAHERRTTRQDNE